MKTCSEAGHWADEYMQMRSAHLGVPVEQPPFAHKLDDIICHDFMKAGHIQKL